MLQWLLSKLPDSWVENLVRKYAGTLITKWLSIASGALVAHGLTNTTTATAWTNSTTEMAVGIVIAALSHWLSSQREQQKQADLTHAASTNPLVQLVLPPVAILSGGVGIGSTNVNDDQH